MRITIIAIIALLGGAAMMIGLTFAFRALPAHQPTGAEVYKAMTSAQRQAYQEAIELCNQRIMQNFHPRSDEEANATMRRLEECTASLGVRIKATWEPWENKWRFDFLPPPQGVR